jgi:hypothetical protein
MVENNKYIVGPKFINKGSQDFYDKNGYVKISLLDEYEILKLKEFYKTVEQEHLKINLPFITTSHSNNSLLIERVNEAILKIVTKSIHQKITNSDIIFSNYLVKRFGEGTETTPHQDLTIVDETKYMSFSIWIPLEKVNNINGAMRFLPKSHLFDISIRPNSSNYWKYNKVINEITADLDTQEADIGEAFVFSHSIIHGSFSNTSKQNRLACVISMHPKGSELYNYFLNENTILQKYKMSKEAFIKYIKGAPPNFAKLLEENRFNLNEVSQEEYNQLKKKVGL